MTDDLGDRLANYVALRKESVDRNFGEPITNISLPESLSARRAWIEITQWFRNYGKQHVALRKESVDRNSVLGCSWLFGLCRSPQGERG